MIIKTTEEIFRFGKLKLVNPIKLLLSVIDIKATPLFELISNDGWLLSIAESVTPPVTTQLNKPELATVVGVQGFTVDAVSKINWPWTTIEVKSIRKVKRFFLIITVFILNFN